MLYIYIKYIYIIYIYIYIYLKYMSIYDHILRSMRISATVPSARSGVSLRLVCGLVVSSLQPPASSPPAWRLAFCSFFKGTTGGVSRMACMACMACMTFFHMFFTCFFQVPSERLFSEFQLLMPLKMELKLRKNKTRGQFFLISGKPCFCNTLQCFCYILRVRGNLKSIKNR